MPSGSIAVTQAIPVCVLELLPSVATPAPHLSRVSVLHHKLQQPSSIMHLVPLLCLRMQGISLAVGGKQHVVPCQFLNAEAIFYPFQLFRKKTNVPSRNNCFELGQFHPARQSAQSRAAAASTMQVQETHPPKAARHPGNIMR